MFIPNRFRNTDEPLMVSVGILNTQEIIDIKARFKCFKVSVESPNFTVSLLKEN